MANSTEYLKNLYENYLLSRLNLYEKARYLGAMEGILIILQELTPGTPFAYNERIVHFKLFWFIPLKWTVREKYEEFILRKTYEILNKI